jgi:hypothetical protein
MSKEAVCFHGRRSLAPQSIIAVSSDRVHKLPPKTVKHRILSMLSLYESNLNWKGMTKNSFCGRLCRQLEEKTSIGAV